MTGSTTGPISEGTRRFIGRQVPREGQGCCQHPHTREEQNGATYSRGITQTSGASRSDRLVGFAETCASCFQGKSQASSSMNKPRLTAAYCRGLVCERPKTERRQQGKRMAWRGQRFDLECPKNAGSRRRSHYVRELEILRCMIRLRGIHLLASGLT